MWHILDNEEILLFFSRFCCDFYRKLVIKDDSPAEEISFCEAHFIAVLTRLGSSRSFDVVFQSVTLNSINAPCPLTGLLFQADLLSVDREHRELRFDECT
jgi:hypothetical protein